MGEVFSSSGEKTDSVVVPTPRLQGLFLPAIDNPQAIDGFGIVTPWGGGNTARRYGDYGISTDISRQNTQLRDLASSFIPAEGAGVTYNFEGLIGPQGPRGPAGPPGITGLTSLPSGYVLPINANYLAALPHNIDQINALGTALDKLVYTTSYDSYFGDFALTERRPAGDVDRAWYGVASDSDGSHLIAGIDEGRLYTSDDSGVTWTERQPAGVADMIWYGVASDSDGSNLIVAAYGGRLYTSANCGVGWTERQPAGNDDFDWDAVASDSDGSHLIAGIDAGRLYTSANSGVNWTERQPAGDDDFVWISVASDSDGSNLIAAAQGGRLYTSANYGVNWTERRPAGDSDINWACVASDSDGSHLIAGILTGRLYTSDDSGATWIERQPAGVADKDWWGVASDSDGSHLIAAATAGRLYTSDDSGVTWTAEDTDRDWNLVASDADGSHLIAAVQGGRLYTGARQVLYSEATWAESDLTSAGRDILGDATAADQATTLGLGTGDSPEFTGLTLSDLTAGRVPFVGTGGLLSDDVFLLWDNTNKYLGVGITPIYPLHISKTCTAAGGLSVLRVTGLQTDGTAMTGTLRGAYIDVSNGNTAATGTIRGMELKARTEAPGDTGNDVTVLEGLSISADSKDHSVTTMRAAEFILDGSTGGTITEAVGLRIANNLQANKATTSYGLQIYRDSFDYTADIQLSSGGLIGGSTGALQVASGGNVGINTATPSKKLEVNGNIKADNIYLPDSGYIYGGIPTYDFYGYSAGNIVIFARGGATIRIDSNNGDTHRSLTIEHDTGADLFKVEENGNVIITSGDFGINETAPETLTEWTGTAPYLTLHNSTHEDTDGGRESRLIFKGEQSGGEETTLAQIEVSHDGSSDDQLGKMVCSVNTGAGIAEGLRINSNADVDIVNDLTAGTIQADNGVSGTLVLDDGTTERITLVFTGGILTSRTVAATVASLIDWTD